MALDAVDRIHRNTNLNKCFDKVITEYNHTTMYLDKYQNKHINLNKYKDKHIHDYKYQMHQ